MKQNQIICKSAEKNLNRKKYFLKNIFDEDFLNEKDIALSPIVLTDEIPGEIIAKSQKETKKKRTNLNNHEVKDIKYGSNIVYIDSKIDDNDEGSHALITEQINRIINERKFCKKTPNRRRTRKKI